MSIDLLGRLAGAKVLVWGFGHHGGGLAAARFCAERGATVSVLEQKAPEALGAGGAEAIARGWAWHLGDASHPVFMTSDLIVASPAIPPRAWPSRHPSVVGPEALFCAAHQGPRLAVTGTKGKSTTAHLCGALLGWTVGGNSNEPLLDVLARRGPLAPVVCELSSFQLHYLAGVPSASASVPHFSTAVFTSLARDHLDWHPDLAHYQNSKLRLLEWADALIVAADVFARLPTGAVALPVVAYRGAGKPEFTYLIERLVDAAARETGRDRAELRRLNMVRPEQMPWTTPVGLVFDSGEFEKNMNDALVLTNRAGFESRRATSAARGRLRGYGFSVYQEPDGYYESHVGAVFDPSGMLTLAVSATTNGQGHMTTFKQVVSQQLGLPQEKIRFVYGDSDLTGVGIGSVGSCETTVTGTAIVHCARIIIEKGRLIAAHLLEAPATDVEFEVTDTGGSFVIAGTDRRIGIVDVARAAHAADLPPEIAPGLEAEDFYKPTAYSFPSGCHVCEVEIDPDTGHVELLSYSAVNDFGVVVNPLLLEGQVHGGVAQGIGQALMEELRHDPQSGQLLTGSFMDYAIPHAEDLPSFGWARNEVPCKTNPLGVKGVGESGCTASLACVMSAVIDALSPRGITAMDMPATSERVWKALNEAGR